MSCVQRHRPETPSLTCDRRLTAQPAVLAKNVRCRTVLLPVQWTTVRPHVSILILLTQFPQPSSAPVLPVRPSLPDSVHSLSRGTEPYRRPSVQAPCRNIVSPKLRRRCSLLPKAGPEPFPAPADESHSLFRP